MTHTYSCPECGAVVTATAAYQVRQQRPCRACIRKQNGWTCGLCGSTDPQHPSPCPTVAAVKA